LEKRVFAQIKQGLENLPKAGFKILVRRDDFVPYGIVTVLRKTEFDPSTGEARTWVEGVRLGSGEFFKEPLDRKNPRTNQLESVVLAENPYLILTARRRPDLSDADDNFMWLDNPFDVQDIRKLREDVQVRDQVVASMRKELETQRKLTSYYEGLASAYGETTRELEERTKRLSREVAMLREQNEHLRMIGRAAMAESIEAESALEKMVKTARERGVEIASSEFERARETAKKLKQLHEEFGPLERPAPPPEEIERYKRELEEERRKREALERELEKKKTAR